MASQDKQNIVDSVMNAQKEAVETIVENTKKFTNGNAMVNDTLQKGSEWYKNWLETQKNIYTQATGKATEATENVKESASKMGEFNQNWFNSEMNWAKQMWEMNTDWIKNATNNTTANSNPMNQMQNMMNNWTSWMSNMGQANNWINQMNQMQNANPFNMDSWKKTGETFTGLVNQYNEIMNNSFAELQKNMQNGTTQDAYKNMVNVAEGFTRFSEMWAPMWKAIEEKTFNTDMYKQYMNPAMYKDVMDKYLGFMPESSRQYFQNFTNMMNDGSKHMNQFGMGNYQQMRDMMSKNGMGGAEVFANMLNSYNQMQNMMNEAAAPFKKMMPANQHTKSASEISDLINRTIVYNIKNAEMQYMIYNQGTKVMDQLAENIAKKVENGETVNSMLALYQEWMNISDKTYVSLFESDEYSKLMAEVSAMQLKLRKDMEGQMEKYFVGIPVATRSEMDEMYKTIYDLKKQVRQLEKMLDLDEETTEEKPAAKKSAKKA